MKALHLFKSSSLYLALGAIACIRIFNHENWSIPFDYYVFVFFSVLLVYNLHRLVKLHFGAYKGFRAKQEEISNLRYFHFILVAFSTLVCSVSALDFIAPFLQYSIWAVLVALAYSIPLLRGKALREIFWFKGVSVSLVWTYVTAILPWLLFDQSSNFPASNLIMLWMSRLLFFYVITGLSDIRDINGDAGQIRTLPQLIGVNKSVGIYASLTAAMTMLQLFAFLDNYLSWPKMLAFGLSNVALFLLCLGAKKNQPENYYSFGVDGVLILQLVLFGVFNDWAL